MNSDGVCPPKCEEQIKSIVTCENFREYSKMINKFKMGKIHLLLLSLICVLLVNLEDISAHSIQDSLPALVLDDENTSSYSSASPELVTRKTASNNEDNVDSKEKAKENDNNESKVIPYKTDKREKQQTPTSNEPPKESNVDSSKETTTSQAPNSADSTTTTAASVKQSVEETKVANKVPVKDINVLLANKDDAENDLASPNPSSNPNGPQDPAETHSEPAQKPSVVVTSNEGKKNTELDSPVDTNKQNDDRLHYSLGNSEQIKPSVEKKAEPKDDTVASSELAPEKPLVEKEKAKEEKKDEEVEKKPVEEKKPDSKDEKDEEEKEKEDGEGEIKKDDNGSASDKELDSKKDVSDEKIKIDEAPKQPSASPTLEAENKDKKFPLTTEQPATTVGLSTAEQTSTELLPSKKDIETSKVDTEGKKIELPRGEKPEREETSKKVPMEASTTVATPISSSASPLPTTTAVAAETSTAKVSNVKPPNVPSILAVALGTALGAAVNPIISNKSDKKPPVVASPSSTISPSSTTKAPSSTTKKSSTDKWDRWTPTPPTTLSSTTSGPTRRRPILPSIRRRFRPYNRFSPFPWGGADAYSPAGGDPEFSATDPLAPKPPSFSSTTNKPSRRRTGSPSGESFPSRPTSIGGSTQAGSSDDHDDNEETLPESSNRRRQGNEHRRRHHHHHRHHHRQNEAGLGESSQTPPRRRVHSHNHHSHRNHDRDERPFDSSPFDGPPSYPPFSSSQPRPVSPGFGLFNTGSQTGSGFDLLNPFSSWLDDFSTNSRPQSHAQPRPPIPVEGKYDDNNHNPHEYGGRFDHHHHDDCHDHDYDYHREPYRPHRDREPNQPRPNYGRRPARPYNRRDQAEHERNNNREHENLDSSQPSLLGRAGTSVAPRVPSIFSPFESLFGSLDDVGFFSLRSSFMDSPLKAASDSTHTFDTIVSSPKILKNEAEQASVSSAINKNSSGASSSISSDKAREDKPSTSVSFDETNNNGKQPTITTSNCSKIASNDRELLDKPNDPYFSLVLTRSGDVGSLEAKKQTSCHDPRYSKGILCQFLKLIHSLKEPISMLI